jgi:hypothetical protein
MSFQSPVRPLLLKGALIVYPVQTPGARPSNVILFQYNPDAMRRTLANRAEKPKDNKTGTAREEILSVAGAPVETINLSIDLHADEQLEDPDMNPVVAEFGLHPALASLELMMYPPSEDTQTASARAAHGAAQIAPVNMPLVLLVWGASRVVPVKLTSFSVNEDAFDTRLNPISAKVELGLQVLTDFEFPDSSIGRDAYIAYQKSKEILARLQVPGSNVSGLRNLLPH